MLSEQTREAQEALAIEEADAWFEYLESVRSHSHTGRYEEVDRLSPSEKGDNLGWRRIEGYKCFNPSSGCGKQGKEKPVLAYAHRNGRCAVTGGFVYRGADIPALRGWYLFADYCSGEIWTVAASAGTHADKILLRNTSANISSFGENPSGELFVVDLGGTIYRIDEG